MHDLTQLDIEARAKALEPAESFIVQAPAGSGKTELLTQRYLVLLQHCKRAPEEILAVTFTRKAQAEMRQRIMSALERGLGEPPEADHEKRTYGLAKAVLKQSESKGWDLLNNPNRLRIMTIDALAHHLVHRMPILAQFGSEPDLAQQADHLYSKAIESFIKYVEKDPVHRPFLEDLLWHLDNHAEKLERLLSQLLAKRDQWLEHIYPFSQNPEEGLEYLESSIGRVIEDALTIASQRFDEGMKQNLIHYAQHAAQQQTWLADKLKPLAELKRFPGNELEDLSQWQCLGYWLLTDKGEIRKRITKAQGFLAPSSAKNKEEKAELQAIKQSFESLLEHMREEAFADVLFPLMMLPPASLTEDEHRLLRALFELLPLLVAHLKVTFREKGEVDHIEISQGALSAMGDEDNPTDLALSLDYQINHILIDEFQDTSVMQYALFCKLISGWQPGDGRTLFLVGDPQQSIYRFRGAEVGLFLKAKAQGMGEVPLTFLQLNRNFRSQAHICEWSNQVFSQVFPKKGDIGLGAVALSPSVATHPSESGGIDIFAFDDKLSECSYIARTLEGMQQTGGTKAILVRARNHLEEIMPMLKALRVPFVATDIEPISMHMVITDLLSLTQAWLDFSHRIAWLSILRAPWCGLSLHDLWCLSRDEASPILYQQLQNAEVIASLSESGQSRVGRLAEVLKPFVERRQRRSLADTIRALWLRLGGPACYATETQALSDAYFECLQAHSRGGGLDHWDEFYNQVSQQFSHHEQSQLSNTAVQLMTIHKAKGLEFDTVILPSLEKRTRKTESELLLLQERPHAHGVDLMMAPAKGPDMHEDKLYHYLQGHISQKNHLEQARLLYVAATRAKSKLILSATLEKDESGEYKPPPASSFMGMLFPAIQQDIKVVNVEVVNYEHQTHSFNLCPTWESPVEAESELEEGLNDKEDLNRPEQINQYEAQIGTMIHHILEVIAEDGLAAWQGRDLNDYRRAWLARLTELNVPNHALAQAIDTVLVAIKNTLSDENGRWILGAHEGAVCEFELAYWQNGKMQKAIIDRSFIDEQGRRWIIDYKSVFYQQPEPEQYLGQLKHYARLMSRLYNEEIMLGLYFPYTKEWWSICYQDSLATA